MKLVCWNKDFYEKYKDVFQIDVFAKASSPFSNTSAWGYTAVSSCRTEEVYLPLSSGWYEENGYLILKKSCVKYPIKDVYMRVDDEVADLFSDLKPWFDYTVSWTTMTL